MSDRLRVAAVFLDLNIGGDENRTLSFARAFDRSRMDYLMITVARPDERRDAELGPMRSRFKEAGIQILDMGEDPAPPADAAPERRTIAQVPGVIVRNARTQSRRARRLAALLREHRIDVIDAHMSAVFFAGFSRRLAPVKGVVATEYGARKWSTPMRRWLARSAYRRVDALISDCRMRVEEMGDSLGIKSLEEIVIPNGVAPPATTFSAAQMRRRLDLPEDPRVRIIGQIARLLPFKGQRELLRAAAGVLAQDPDVAFLICGFEQDHGYRLALEQQAKDLGIADRVRIVSYPGPTGDVWAAIDIHAHPTLIDSSPLAIAEGMSLGKPAVVAAVGGIPELVDHERTGLLVPPGDVDALTAALLRVLQNPDEARAFGAAARQRYERNHTPQVMARALEDLFMRVGGRQDQIGPHCRAAAANGSG